MSKNRLLTVLQELRLPSSLILWISSFLDHRLLRLSFDGQIEGFSAINTGIPQGSPISPILFLIYIRGLFDTPAARLGLVKYLSYINDILITTKSTSTKKNAKILQKEVDTLYKLALENAI